MNDPFQQIVGEHLSAVTFVQDYLQLQFDGPSLNALTVVTVTTPGGHAKSGEDQFRNLLCSCITKKVLEVTVKEHEALNIDLADGFLVSVSLRDRDYDGPEAVTFRGKKNEIVVI
jgi:hypothetical protein